jgi:hypothetical protein
VKFIDSTEPLSVQVHPGDHHFAAEKGSGKSELWYVVAAEPGAKIYVGFNREMDASGFCAPAGKNHPQVLNVEQVSAGDVFYIPAGRIHAIGGGVTLCEIQQSADTTYRVYDWDRPGMDGKPRALHIAEALEVIDFRLGKVLSDPIHGAPKRFGHPACLPALYRKPAKLSTGKSAAILFSGFLRGLRLPGRVIHTAIPWGKETISKGRPCWCRPGSKRLSCCLRDHAG